MIIFSYKKDHNRKQLLYFFMFRIRSNMCSRDYIIELSDSDDEIGYNSSSNISTLPVSQFRSILIIEFDRLKIRETEKYKNKNIYSVKHFFNLFVLKS